MNTLQRLAGLAFGLLLSTTALLAQTTIEVDPPYNPDANEDGIVGSADLMGLLGEFGYDFTPESIFVDGMTLEEYLLELTAWMTELEGQISSSTTTSFGVTDVIVNPDNTLQFTFSDGTTLDTPLLVGPAGPQGEPGLPDGTTLAPGTILMWNGSEWDTVTLLGCTDDTADNYNPEAFIENGTCSYCGGVSTLTYDGYTYNLVEIGSQCWFVENLRTQHYANGDAISGNLMDGEWGSITAGGQAVYNNDASNLTTYGRLYNWYSVDDVRGLCPNGWHVPSDEEFTQLTNYLGGGNVAGSPMKSSINDLPDWDGTNSSGFSALPGGCRFYYGEFIHEGVKAYFWSSTPRDSGAWYRGLNPDDEGVERNDIDPRCGLSIRCVRD